MNRTVRKIAIAAAVLFAVILLLGRLVDVNTFRPKLEAELTSVLGRNVKLGELSLSVVSGTVSAADISIGDDPAFSKEPFITAKSLSAGADIMPLIFSKTLHITGITLDQPQITLLRGANGAWNFSTLGGGSAPKAGQPAERGGTLSVAKLNIENGRMLVGVANSAEKPEVYDKVNLDMTGISSESQFPFQITAALPGGGDLDLKGKCGPLSPGRVGATPFEASLAVRNLDIAASGFVSPATGIQGVADFEGTLNADGSQIKAAGTLNTEKLKLAANGAPSKRPIAVKFALDYDLKTDAGTLAQGDIAIGKAVARASGSYQKRGSATSLNMKIDAGAMPVDEIEAALPAIGVVLPSGSKLQGGSLSVNLNIQGQTGALVMAGPIQLSNAKLAGFDLGSKMSVIPGLSGKGGGGKDTTLQNCSATVRAAPESTQISAINVNIPSLGVVTGSGSISPSGALNFAMNADLSAAGPGVIRKGGGQGDGTAFGIEGTLSDPKFVPNVKSMVGGAISGRVSEKKSESPRTGKFGRR
jgi:AsmA protein